MPVPVERSCSCVLRISILPLSTMFLLEFGNVPTVRYLFYFITRQFKDGSCLNVCFVCVCLRIVMSNILLYQMSLRSEFHVVIA